VKKELGALVYSLVSESGPGTRTKPERKGELEKLQTNQGGKSLGWGQWGRFPNVHPESREGSYRLVG